MQLISKSTVIIVITTKKHLIYVCHVMADESRSLMILYDVGIGEDQLSDKNWEVSRDQKAGHDHTQPVVTARI